MHRLVFVSFVFLFTSFAVEPRVRTICGTGVAGYAGDGGLAVAAQIRNPYGLVLAADGALYLCDMENHVIRRVKEGRITTVAGTGRRGYSGDGGPAVKAELNEPYEVRLDGEGNLYFVEMQNHLVRRVTARDGTISTIAGSGTAGFSGDGGPATKAQLRQPHSIQLDGKGHLYICDIGNHRVRKVDLQSGLITTFAGTGAKTNPRDGGRFAEEPLFGPRALDFDQEGNIWLALREGNAIYKLDLRSGTIHHMAGSGVKGAKDGPAQEATLSGPKGISVAPNGDVYFADTESHTIRLYAIRDRVVRTVAGAGERGQGPDGAPLECKLARPHGVFVASDGTIYIGDSENNRIRSLAVEK